MFSVEEIMKFVPHRYPFLLIDRVLEFEAEKKVVTLKNITINEAQFQGHFPGRPIFPGVYILENMAQSGCFLLAKSAGALESDKVYYLGKIAKASFMKPVVPGDQMITTIDVEKIIGSMALITAYAEVEGKKVAKAEMAFAAA